MTAATGKGLAPYWLIVIGVGGLIAIYLSLATQRQNLTNSETLEEALSAIVDSLHEERRAVAEAGPALQLEIEAREIALESARYHVANERVRWDDRWRWFGPRSLLTALSTLTILVGGFFGIRGAARKRAHGDT